MVRVVAKIVVAEMKTFGCGASVGDREGIFENVGRPIVATCAVAVWRIVTPFFVAIELSILVNCEGEPAVAFLMSSAISPYSFAADVKLFEAKDTW